MESVLAIVVGCLYAAGIYMMLRRSLFKLILGLVLLSHGANLLIFTVGGLSRGRPPVAAPGTLVPADASADPLPQALILTAIVIGFAVTAFSLVLFHRGYQTFGSDDPDDLKVSDL
jgi:multicomponent Na+:H+ antiporter subunit C